VEPFERTKAMRAEPVPAKAGARMARGKAADEVKRLREMELDTLEGTSLSD